MTAPANPAIYHIVHIDRLSSILTDAALFSDHLMSQRPESVGTNIGMSKIKERRLTIPVNSSSGGTVGQYVPFYFCPRSIMLYIMFKGDHSEVAYRGGQRPIIHLVSDFDAAVEWASENNGSWAFTSSNAGAFYTTKFYESKEDLNKLDWVSIPLRNFTSKVVSEAKHSEFLFKNSFPWKLFKEIGVCDQLMKKEVEALLLGTEHKPIVTVRGEWYY